MENGAVRVRDRRKFGDGLNRADFVVRVHHRYERGVIGDGVSQPVGRDDPCRVERQDRRSTAALGQRLEGVEHGFVLDARGDQVAASGDLECLGGAANREVIRFGAPAREDDFRRFGAHEGRH
jgi:hypothetical protein